jgi:hypothetical protein
MVSAGPPPCWGINLPLLIIVLRGGGASKLLKPVLRLLDLVVDGLLVARLKLAPKALVIRELGLQRVDD